MLDIFVEILEDYRKAIFWGLFLILCSYLMIHITESNPEDLIAIIFGKAIMAFMGITKVVGFIFLGIGLFKRYLF